MNIPIFVLLLNEYRFNLIYNHMKKIDGFIKESKIRNNFLYCITVKNGQEHLDEAFEIDCMTYLEEDDGDCISGFDVENESIYFTFIDESKVRKMIDFFKRNGILIKYEKVSNIIDFINNDKKYLRVYSDERNRSILNTYIKIHVTVDNVLERLHDNKHNDEFSLLPIEKEILTMS